MNKDKIEVRDLVISKRRNKMNKDRIEVGDLVTTRGRVGVGLVIGTGLWGEGWKIYWFRKNRGRTGLWHGYHLRKLCPTQEEENE